MGFSDRDLVKQIQENPYYQYFIGLESFQHAPPFAPILLVEWRKRIDTSLMTIAFSVLVTNIFGSFKLAVEDLESDSSTTV